MAKERPHADILILKIAVICTETLALALALCNTYYTGTHEQARCRAGR